MELNTITPETLKTSFVTPEDCFFSQTAGGFLRAVIHGKEHKRVILSRALPLSAPERFICITDVDKKELGIIEDVSVFSEEQQRLINGELEMRYYCPVISSVDGIKEKMGQFYFDVTIGDRKKSFTVKDISKSIRMNGNNVDITDVDANRYRITDFEHIPAKSRRKLEPYIY